MVETHTYTQAILNLKGIADGLPKLSKKLAYHDAHAHTENFCFCFVCPPRAL